MDARYRDFRAKLQTVKALYLRRHYTQCAKFAEQVLAESNQIHPIHITYLHFYAALSHDTLAREATLKNRCTELSLAEKQYLDAIAALTSHQSATKLDENEEIQEEEESIDSPTSPWYYRSSNATFPGSVSSKTASSTSSYSPCSSSMASPIPQEHKQEQGQDEEYECIANFNFPRPPRSHSSMQSLSPPSAQKDRLKRKRHHTIYISTQPCQDTERIFQDEAKQQKQQQEQKETRRRREQQLRLHNRTTHFLTLLTHHLASVHALQIHANNSTKKMKPSPAATVHFTPSSRSSSTTAAKPLFLRSSPSEDYNAEQAQRLWQARRTRVFRRRFDPEAVRRLCGDVLAELG